MNIIAEALPGNPFGGFQAAAENDGHRWVWWEEQHTPAFDVFDEVKPDLFLCVSEPSKAAHKCITERQIPYVTGDFDDEFTFRRHEEYKVDHCPNEGRIRRFEFDMLYDSHRFYIAPVDQSLECQIAVTCSPSANILKMCEQLGQYNIKVVGEEVWGVPQYLGYVSLDFRRRLFNSAEVVVVDTISDTCRVLACGSIPISNNQELSEAFDGKMFVTEEIDEVLGTDCKTADEHYDKLHTLIKEKTYEMVLKHLIEDITYEQN